MKRKVGRPRNPERAANQAARRSLSIDKTPKFMALLNKAHGVYQTINGRPGAHSKVIMAALAAYVGADKKPSDE